MAKIVNLDIKNFRGIKELPLKFDPDQNLICLIGRGDSGKTTILDAISSVLSPSWNMSFYDTDFYQCNPKKPIKIEATLINLPDKLLSENKFGLYLRAFNPKTNDIDDDVAIDSLIDPLIPALTIMLTVDESLEPKWFITNTREQEDIPISGRDRALLNCFMISDYIDRHFSWNKGNPLYALLRSNELEETSDEKNIIIQSLREAKKNIDDNGFSGLDKVTNIVKSHALEIGLDIGEASTTLDFKELSIKDGRISLHENLIPFRQKGKGSKRLASLAIQTALVQDGGIMLVDEIEQGLEPDRIKQLARHLKEICEGQIFITTHSRDAIIELGAETLLFLLKDKKTHDIEKRSFKLNNEELQKAVRACPEAFFARKVIVCEGATEFGICRAMDKWRKQNSKPQMSFKDCAYIDGTGNTLVSRTKEISGCMKTALFCDSDDKAVNTEKQNLVANIFDCEDGLNIEQQVFKDLPWRGVIELLQYAQENNLDSFNFAFSEYIKNTIDTWCDTESIRTKISLEFKPKKDGSSSKKWFKGIHHGEFIGDVIFRHIDSMDNEARLKTTLTGLSDWIDKVTV